MKRILLVLTFVALATPVLAAHNSAHKWTPPPGTCLVASNGAVFCY